MTCHQQAYWEARGRAAYYLWCALRGHAIPGNDPVTGRRRGGHDTRSRREGRAAYKALYRVARLEARSLFSGNIGAMIQ